MKELNPNYNSETAEKSWQDHWRNAGTYHYAGDSARSATFVIDTPPPTVSGLLHMGHVFSYTQCDFLARFQRMQGKDVFYPMGFDDNGLPTERLVEKTLKIRAADMTREEFIKACENVSDEARAEFRTLFESIALSVDWRQEYHTISEESRRLSQLSFLDLVEKNHVEHRLQPFFWDPADQTAIAQAEIEDKETHSLWHDIWFQSEDGDKLLIGTTRPELLPACVALFYHPGDERYAKLEGKRAFTPLFNISVPILSDDTVDPEKGTGLMMCCTFGDEADIDKWRRFNLPMRTILNRFGKIDLNLPLAPLNDDKENAGDFPLNFQWQEVHLAVLQGKKASNKDPKHPGARELIVKLLEEAGALKESRQITHTVKCAERSGAPLEILPTHQWFIKVMDKKETLLKRSAECIWHPEWMKQRLDQWIDGLNSDWCISRQRYFGVPFPVWYSRRAGEEGKIIYAEKSQLPCNPLVDLPHGYSRDEVIADSDVMDTWATSSISPQLSSKWLLDKERHNKLFPADLRPQAHEIIRSWAFYTIVKSELHENSLPWRHIAISGWCLAEDKTKMSKSKGNVVTPVDLIHSHGTDAVRYWAATSRLGNDTAFSTDLLKIGKKLVTKLWNSSKFVAIQLEHLNGRPEKAADDIKRRIIIEPLDLWAIHTLAETIKKAESAFTAYEYADALRAAEDYFWNVFCDQYLELVKARAYGNGSETARQSALYTLYHCLKGVLRLFAPFTPHITEELFCHLYREEYAQSGSIHARGQWPDAAHYKVEMDAMARSSGAIAVELLNAVRKAKSERGVSIKTPIDELTIAATTPEKAAELALFLDSSAINDVKSAGSIEIITLVDKLEDAGAIASEQEHFRLLPRFADNKDIASIA